MSGAVAGNQCAIHSNGTESDPARFPLQLDSSKITGVKCSILIDQIYVNFYECTNSNMLTAHTQGECRNQLPCSLNPEVLKNSYKYDVISSKGT